MSRFKKATKQAARLRAAFIGPAGSGKTYSALELARHLGQRVALIDSERGSASKYADIFDFEVCELADFSPKSYVDAIRDASREGFDVLVIDSLSHAWVGKGGVLDMHGSAVDRQKTKNTYTAWRDVTPEHNSLVDGVLQCDCHVIATIRAKTEYVQEKDGNGKTSVRKVGLAPVQRDGLEYEFDIVGDLDEDNILKITKTRCPLLAGTVHRKPGRDFAEIVKGWLGTAPDKSEVLAELEQCRTEEEVMALKPRVESLRQTDREALTAECRAKIKLFRDQAKARLQPASVTDGAQPSTNGNGVAHGVG